MRPNARCTPLPACTAHTYARNTSIRPPRAPLPLRAVALFSPSCITHRLAPPPPAMSAVAGGSGSPGEKGVYARSYSCLPIEGVPERARGTLGPSLGPPSAAPIQNNLSPAVSLFLHTFRPAAKRARPGPVKAEPMDTGACEVVSVVGRATGAASVRNTRKTTPPAPARSIRQHAHCSSPLTRPRARTSGPQRSCGFA